MTAHRAELSSMASVLDDLSRRVVSIAKLYDADDEQTSVAGELYEVERTLAVAVRRLERAAALVPR